VLHGAKPRRRRRSASQARVYAQPNFELLIPEECPADLHREIASIARIRSLDRFWTYVLSPDSVARGVEEGLTAEQAVEKLESVVEGTLPSNVSVTRS